MVLKFFSLSLLDSSLRARIFVDMAKTLSPRSDQGSDRLYLPSKACFLKQNTSFRMSKCVFSLCMIFQVDENALYNDLILTALLKQSFNKQLWMQSFFH